MAVTAGQHTTYCFQCNEYCEVGASRYVTSNTGRKILQGTCEECRSETSRYADDSSATSGMPNIGENLVLPCPSCGEGAGKQSVERQPGNAWNFGYPANIHSTRAEMTTLAAKLVQREAVRRNEAAEAAELDAERRAMWKEGRCGRKLAFASLSRFSFCLRSD